MTSFFSKESLNTALAHVLITSKGNEIVEDPNLWASTEKLRVKLQDRDLKSQEWLFLVEQKANDMLESFNEKE